ncbi:MAG: hypothetical protein JWO44_760 [Bacteroidetes bacterium]|nr:hypothetical protein [Bacteroidota bacterium]
MHPKRYSEKIKRKNEADSGGLQLPAGNLSGEQFSIIRPLFEPHFKSILGGGEIRAKLEISQPEDQSEVQADEMASSFMQGNAEQSRQILSGQNPSISKKEEGSGMETSGSFDQQLQSTKGQGQKLDEGTQAKLEEHTDTDLSDVNIHTGSKAHELSESINAKAFAHGQDIYFKQGNYNPQSNEGKELLAHEVAHTVQQGGDVKMKVQRDEVKPVTSYQHGAKSLYVGPQAGQYSSSWEELVHRFFNGVNESKEHPEKHSKQRLKDKPKENDQLMYRIWHERPNQKAFPDEIPDVYEWAIPQPADGNKYVANEEIGYQNQMNIDKSFGFKIEEEGKAPYTVYYRVLYKPGILIKSGEKWKAERPTIEIEFISDSSEKLTNAATTNDYGLPIKAIDYWIQADPDAEGKSAERTEWRYADSYPKSLKGKKHNQYEYFKTPEGKTAQKDISKFLYKKYNDLKSNEKLPNERFPISENVLAGGQKFYIDASFWKNGSNPPSIGSIYILHLGVTETNAPAEAFTKDSTDILINYAGANDIKTKLTITGAEKITDRYERAIARYYAYMLTVAPFSYESADGGLNLRDTEMDRIITVDAGPAGKKEIYYTFIIGTEDPVTHALTVDVQRIGEKGVDLEDPEKLRIQDAAGYPAGKPVTDIQTWITARYGKKIALSEIQGATEKEVCDKTNQLMEARAGLPGWFSDIYGITIKNASDAVTEMTTELGYSTPTNNPSKVKAFYVFDTKQNKEVEAAENTSGATKVTDETAGAKDFQEFELKLLEQSLQKMSSSFLKIVNGTVFIRQSKCLLKDHYDIPAGMTSPRKDKGQTISIFDNAYGQKQIFVGGKKDVTPVWAWSLTHELGHVVAHEKSKSKTTLNQQYEKIFNDFIAKIRGAGNPILPPTEYSRQKTKISEPGSEFFPEAFTLFMLDPEWLIRNQPEVYLWFKWLEAKEAAPDYKDIQKEVQQKVVNGVLTGQ